MSNWIYTEHLPLMCVYAHVGHIYGIDYDKVSKEILHEKLVFSKGYGFRTYPKSEECEKLKSSIEDMANSILPVQSEIVDIWAVATSRGESVSYHSHASNTHMQPEEYWSGIIYTAADEDSAEIVLHSFGYNRIESMMKIKPEVGKVVFFNSFVPHHTTKHESLDIRVGVSFNLKPKNPVTTEIPNMKIYRG